MSQRLIDFYECLTWGATFAPAPVTSGEEFLRRITMKYRVAMFENSAFMALPDAVERGRFLAEQFFLHRDAFARYAQIKSIDEAEKHFEGRVEMLRDMVCERAGMPDLWEMFCSNFARLYKEAQERVQEAEWKDKMKV